MEVILRNQIPKNSYMDMGDAYVPVRVTKFLPHFSRINVETTGRRPFRRELLVLDHLQHARFVQLLQGTR